MESDKGDLYPNLYIFLVGVPGVGKSQSINAAMKFLREVKDLKFGASSMTMASLVDALVEAKRVLNDPGLPVFNSIMLPIDELSVGLRYSIKDENSMISGLTKFYDVSHYSERRRTSNLNISIDRPQVNLLAGTTPSHLLGYFPDKAWEEGFASRVIMVYGDKSKPKPFAKRTDKDTDVEEKKMTDDLVHISSKLIGNFRWTEEFEKAVNNWIESEYYPVPEHPKLAHYNTRRETQLLKLSMISSVDREDDLILRVEDFNQALGWLVEAETFMPSIFDQGGANADSQAMADIVHFVSKAGPIGVSEHQVVSRILERFKGWQAKPVLEALVQSGKIIRKGYDKLTGTSRYYAP